MSKKPKGEQPTEAKAPSLCAVVMAVGRDTVQTVLNDRKEAAVQFAPTNPRRPGAGTHTAWEAYSKARTVGEAMELGWHSGHARWDLARGYAVVDGVVDTLTAKPD